MPQYISETLDRMIKMKEENLSQIFEQAKEKLLQDWKNFYLDQSYKQIRPTLECLFINLKFEKKHLRTHLEKFTFDSFNQYLTNWLKTGRSVWYICGNYSHDKCIELVEESRKKFNLTPVKIEDLPELRTVALEAQTSFHIEMPLEDKTNENSCNLTYFEVGPIGDNTKEKLINDIVMQCLDEPFYADLRTKQQLGYVVYCRTLKIQDVIGNIFTV